MARPRDPAAKRNRIYSTRYAHGHCEPIGGVTYIRLPDGVRRSTGLRWGPATADDARTLLDDALAAYYAAGRSSARIAVTPARAEDVVATTVRLVGNFADEYVRLALADAPKRLQWEHRSARRHYLDATLPMDAETIERHLLERNATSALTAGTRRQYLMRLRQMFDWAVRRGMLDRNPIAVIPPPKLRREKIPGYTAEEIAAIVRYFTERADAPPRDVPKPDARRVRRATPPVRVRATHWLDYALAVRLQVVTAMRSAELLGLRRDDVQGDALRIVGKGGRVRYFPLTIPPKLQADASEVARARVAWLAEVRAIIDTLMAREPIRGGWLFAVRDRSRYRDHIHDAKSAAGIADDERVSHAIRKYALWHWREALLLDAEVRAELAGHGEDVAEGYYNKARTASEAMRAIVLSRL